MLTDISSATDTRCCLAMLVSVSPCCTSIVLPGAHELCGVGSMPATTAATTAAYDGAALLRLAQLGVAAIVVLAVRRLIARRRQGRHARHPATDDGPPYELLVGPDESCGLAALAAVDADPRATAHHCPTARRCRHASSDRRAGIAAPHRLARHRPERRGGTPVGRIARSLENRSGRDRRCSRPPSPPTNKTHLRPHSEPQARNPRDTLCTQHDEHL